MKKKESTPQKPLVDYREVQSMVISVVVHLFVLFLILLSVVQPTGEPDSESISVSFESGDSDLKNEEEGKFDGFESEAQENPIPVPESQETNEDAQEEVLDATENLEDYLPEDTTDVDTYVAQYKQRAEAKAKRIAQLSKQSNNISSNVAQRSSLKKLEPRTFYGVKVHAHHIIFMLDISGSMNIDNAKRQIKNAYNLLEGGESFTIIAYADYVLIWKEAVVKATQKNKAEADSWVDSIRSGGGTNIHGALQAAFRISHIGMKAETIYFVSDGYATVGLNTPPEILRDVKKWNKSKNIVIHSIGIGHRQEVVFLTALAQQNYGRYYRR